MGKTHLTKSEILRVPHIRWNWEPSLEDEGKIRYHFVFVDHRRIDRERLRNYVFQRISQIRSGIELVGEEISGKVYGTGLEYLFVRFETPIGPEVLNLYRTGKISIQDRSLIERRRGSVKDRVAELYAA